MMVVAHLLAAEDFGRLSLAQSTALMLHSLIVAGLGTGVVKLVAEFRAVSPEQVSRVISTARVTVGATAVLVFVVVTASADYISNMLFYDAYFRTLIIGSTIYVACVALAEIEAAALIGYEAFRHLAAAQCVGGILGSILLIIMTMEYQLIGAGVGLALAGICQLASNYGFRKYRLQKDIVRLKQRWAPNEFLMLARYAIPTLAAGLVVVVASWFATLILARSAGFAELGVFNLARQWLAAVGFLPLMLARSSFPVFSNQIAMGRLPEASSTLRQGARLITVISLLCCIPLAIGSPWLIGAYGPAYAGGWPTVLVLLVVGVFQAPNGLHERFILAMGRTIYPVLVNVTWAIIVLTTSISMAQYGSIGVAAAFLVAQIVRNALLRYGAIHYSRLSS